MKSEKSKFKKILESAKCDYIGLVKVWDVDNTFINARNGGKICTTAVFDEFEKILKSLPFRAAEACCFLTKIE